MNTAFLLMAQYDGAALIPLDRVVQDYFPHLSTRKFLTKVRAGDITLPVTTPDPSQKSTRFVALTHLADYLDQRAREAKREQDRLCG